MSGTILQNLQKPFDGLYLLESFESVNFTSDQGWSVLNGVPTISNDTSHDGLRSLKMDTTYPQIEKTFTNYVWSAGWFFDDAAIVAGGFTPFLNWITSTPATYGLGVDLATSTTHYTKIVNGVLSATGVARANGWHRFEFMTVAGTTTLKIDGVVVSAAAAVGTPVKVRVGAYVYAGTPAFGYFDQIQVTAGTSINLLAQNKSVAKAFKADGTLLATATVAGGIAQLDVSSTDQPFDGYLSVTKTDGISSFYQSDPRSLSAGDGYILDIYEFGRKPTTMSVPPEMVKRDDKESNNGVQQSVFYFSRDMATLTFSDLTSDEKDSLMRWWTNAKKGRVFGVAIDGNGTYYSKLTAAALGIGVVTLTAASVTGINKGAWLSIKNATGSKREVKKVASATAPSTIIVDSYLANSYETGDEVRDRFFWPFALTTDKALQVSLSNVKRNRWTATINVKEALF